MKEARQLDIDDCINNLATFDQIIDVRSPGEFALDHIPGASNLPVLTNQEREEVGSINANNGAFEAKRRGAALVCKNIERILTESFADKPRTWKVAIYCWRGGNRSASLATVLARIGWQTSVVTGGYQAFRRLVNRQIPELATQLPFRVLAGRTGSGKSRVLNHLLEQGQQILDLEALADHRGSVLGLLPGTQQPSQKRFDTRLWQAIRSLDRDRTVFVESESRKIGQVQVPNALIEHMRRSPCTVLTMSVADRARFLLNDYPHFVKDPSALLAQIDRLTGLHSHAQIKQWHDLIAAQQWSGFVESILERHYDPAYDKSMHRNYTGIAQAAHVTIRDTGDGDKTFRDVASQIAQ